MEEAIKKLATYSNAEVPRQPKRIIIPDEALISNGLINSVSLMDIGLFFEDKFSVRIDDAEFDAENFDTLQQLALPIQGRQ